MKYIVLNINLGKGLSKEIPILFPNDLVHADVVAALQTIEHLGRATCVSAGHFSSLNIDGRDFHGESESLHIKSRPTDGKMITMYDYLHGINDD